MKYSDYYAALGVEKNVTEQALRKAYRQLAKAHHPDRHPGDDEAERRFKEINEAYEVLSDPDKRLRYDQLGANWNQYGDIGDEFSGFSRRPGSQKHRVEFGSQIFDLNFSDFFETFFGPSSGSFWEQHTHRFEEPELGFQQRRKSKATTGGDIEYTAEISLEEAMTGTKRRIQIREDHELKTIEVQIPAGVKEGSKVRVNSPNGHFFLCIKLRPHPVFKGDGNSLRRNLLVMDYEAILGVSKNVDTLNGSVQMKIPAGSQAGQTFRIRGQGLPDLKHKDQRGDILVTLEVKTSKNLSDEEQRLITRFRDLREGKSK